MGHHAGISSANTRSVPTASATAKISCAYARPVQVNMVASNPGVLYRELRPPLDSGCDRHHKICDWYRVRVMPATTAAKSKLSPLWVRTRQARPMIAQLFVVFALGDGPAPPDWVRSIQNGSVGRQVDLAVSFLVVGHWRRAASKSRMANLRRDRARRS